MTFQSDTLANLEKRDLADYGFARARDSAFDAVYSLWLRRQQEGMKKRDIADILGRDPAWVTRNLQGPGNWTMRTFGEFVAALRGEVEIAVNAAEDPIHPKPNYDAYSGYGQTVSSVPAAQPIPSSAPTSATINGLLKTLLQHAM